MDALTSGNKDGYVSGLSNIEFVHVIYGHNKTFIHPEPIDWKKQGTVMSTILGWTDQEGVIILSAE